MVYGRIALATPFLSGVADRFGLWRTHGGWTNFADFEGYTAQVNSFMPPSVIPFLAWVATFFELLFGLSLLLGFRVRLMALGSAILLALFGTAMAISFGIKSPLDYSVFSASAGALLLSKFYSSAPVAADA
jgi:uncharacterized membrane protein YphA (DoxX/SURF4 family)